MGVVGEPGWGGILAEEYRVNSHAYAAGIFAGGMLYYLVGRGRGGHTPARDKVVPGLWMPGEGKGEGAPKPKSRSLSPARAQDKQQVSRILIAIELVANGLTVVVGACCFTAAVGGSCCSSQIALVVMVVVLSWLWVEARQSPHAHLWAGWWQTLASALGPSLFGREHETEAFECQDGEIASVWWPRGGDVGRTGDGASAGRHLWVLLPGGMGTAASGYTEDMQRAGLFEGCEWCAFHNPGIDGKVVQRVSPPGLTETTYLEEFVLDARCRRGYVSVSIIGMSAGSMLAVSIAARADELDMTNRQAKRKCRVAPLNYQGRLLAACVGVCGPDKIRLVFESHSASWLRLDIYFSILLWTILIGAGVQETVPALYFPGCRGWKYMVWITEQCFGREWAAMEDELWACHTAMARPLATPVLRLLSRNDPVIPIEGVDPSLFQNLNRVLVLEDGGHCGIFKHRPEMASEIREWWFRVRAI